MFPTRRVLVLLLRVVVWTPAYVAIGMWFIFQLVSGLGLFGAGSQQGGVAYAAHIGGFLAGLALVNVFVPTDFGDGRRRQEPIRWPEQD